MFILRPRIEWDNSNMFMGGTLINNRVTDIYSSYGGTNLENFMIDKQKGFMMKYKLDRCVLTFDVVLIFSTLMEQINYARETGCDGSMLFSYEYINKPQTENEIKNVMKVFN